MKFGPAIAISAGVLSFSGVAVAALLWCSVPALSDPACGLYQYKAIITEVYDGDSVSADIDLGFHVWIKDEKLRLLGIDAPEVKGDTKVAGLAARDALRARVLGREIILCTVKDGSGNDRREKFGRYLAKIYIGDELINDWMIGAGFAVKYDGGPRGVVK